MARNGVICNPNIPSEEVFTTPHALKVNGYVRSTKPLSHQGSLIEDISVTFKDGCITKASASKGQEVFLKLIDTDEGARRLPGALHSFFDTGIILSRYVQQNDVGPAIYQH